MLEDFGSYPYHLPALFGLVVMFMPRHQREYVISPP